MLHNKKTEIRSIPQNWLKTRLKPALEEAAMLLQRRVGRWSQKSLVMGLLLFSLLSGGASLYILVASFLKKMNPVAVTPIQMPQGLNNPSVTNNPLRSQQVVTPGGGRNLTGALPQDSTQ